MNAYFIGSTYVGIVPKVGGMAAFIISDVTNLPQAPKIRFLNRVLNDDGTQTTFLKWDTVSLDVANGNADVTSYNVYRSYGLNTENLELVATITSRDFKGFLDTMFVETISGFYRYCVSATNALGEGGKSCATSVSSAQLDRI
jgi:hypothetical protein